MRTLFPLPGSVLRQSRCVHAAAVLILLALSGCCIECKDKPGVVLRGDWSVELNRSRAIERVSEWVPCDPGEDSSGGRRKKRKDKHHAPCGKWGCLRCALGPSTGDEDLDSEEGEEKQENKSLTVTAPQYMGQYPYLALPGMPLPGISPFYAGAPGFGGPMGGFMPQPIPVVNPRTGQQHLMVPVLPGQPGVLMLHAQNGQPVMVNPTAPVPSPFAAPLAGGPGYGNYAHPQLNPALAMQQQAMQQPGMIGTGLPPYGMQPPYGNPGLAPTTPPWGAAMVDPATGQLVPNPNANPGGMYAQNSMGGPLPPNEAGPDGEKAASKDGLRSQMPTPRFHPVPTQPVFQRTEGLATTKEAEEEQRLKQLKLERALGMKVPDGAKIAPNGVNQQILQTGASSSLKGGGPVNGSPFSSINGILGLSDDETVKGRRPSDSPEKNYRANQQSQLLAQKAQILELQKELQKSRSGVPSNALAIPPEEQKQIWSQLLDGSESVSAETVSRRELDEIPGSAREKSRLTPSQSAPPQPLKTPKSKIPSISLSSFSPAGLLAPSQDAENAARVARQTAAQTPAKQSVNPLKVASRMIPSWSTPKPQPGSRVPASAPHVHRVAGAVPKPTPDENQAAAGNEPNPIRQVSRAAAFDATPLDAISTETLFEEEDGESIDPDEMEEDEEAEEAELPPLIQGIRLEPREIVQIQLQEEPSPMRPSAHGPRRSAPVPGAKPAAVHRPGPVPSRSFSKIPVLNSYGKK